MAASRGTRLYLLSWKVACVRAGPPPLAFSNTAVGYCSFSVFCIAAGIGTSNFLRAAFIVSLKSSSFGSIKNIPLNCLVLSSFGFSTAHVGFAFFFTASDIDVHLSGHTSGREVFRFLVLVESRIESFLPVGCFYRVGFAEEAA